MNSWIVAPAVLVSAMTGAVLAQVPPRPPTRPEAVQPHNRPGAVRLVRPRAQRALGVAAVEGEAFVPTAHASDGRVSRQSMRVFGESWSGDAQLRWAPQRVDARLELTFNAPEAGDYALAAYLTKGPEYGRFQLGVHGRQIGAFDGFGRQVVRSEKTTLGTATLQRGENTLVFVITGKDPRSTGYCVGVDRLELALLPEGAVRPGARGADRVRSDRPKPSTIPIKPFADAARGAHVDGSVVIEGEGLVATARASLGQPVRQSMVYFGRSWSGDAQLLWRASRLGARLFVTVDAPKAGDYTVAGRFTRAPDYGRFQLFRPVQKQAYPIGPVFDGYDVRVVPSEKIAFGSVPLEAGANQLVFEIVGKNRRSTGYFAGIDALELTPATVSRGEFVLAAAEARTLPRHLTAAQRRHLDLMARELKAGRTDVAKARWNHVVRGMTQASEKDVDAMVQWVLREAYLENNADLKAYAETLRSHNENKKQLRDALGDDAQLANVDLQNHLQKQQQTLQTMSNVSKMLHDTAMAVIRKIGN